MSASEVIVQSRQRLEELAGLTPGHFTKASQLMGKDSAELEKGKGPLTWFDELHAMDSHWNRSGLIAKLARELPLGSGIDILAEADRLLAEWEADGTIIRLKDDPTLQQARWCSRDQWFLELTVLPAAKKRADEQSIRLMRVDVEKAIAEHEAAMSKKLGKTIQLSDEQKASVFHVASETGGLACIIGQAGTGKSASAGAYVRAFKAAGRRVIGTSTSQAATDNLRKEAEIEGMNTAELLHALDKGKLTLSATDVIVLDEAGMVGAKTFRRIQKHVDKAGAKLIAVGDPKQLEAIEAGGPFAQLCEKFGAAAITQIMRQRDMDARSLAESFYNEKKTGADIVEEMLAKGMLRTEKRQVKALAQAYLADERDAQDKLIVVHTHADGAAVDNYVRRGLKESGGLAEKTAKTLTLGSGEYERELEVCIGERIRFQKNDRKDKNDKRRWNNNDIGTVVSFKRATNKRGLVMVVKMDEDGRTVEVDTQEFQRFGYAYARTAHSAQGLGAESVYWLARGGMIDRNAGLVAMTRTKDNFHAFASPEEVSRLANALDEWGQKETVMELARRRNAPAVARELERPLVSSSTDTPVATDDVARVKHDQAEELRVHNREVQRAKQDLSWAKDEWQKIRAQEHSVILVNLAKAEDVIKQYEGMHGGKDKEEEENSDQPVNQVHNDDEYHREAMKKKAEKAALEIARCGRRIAVLDTSWAASTPADKERGKKERDAWLDKFYIGGAAAAREDAALMKADFVQVSFRQRAAERRRVFLERERAVDRAIEQGGDEKAVLWRRQQVADMHALADRIQGRRRALTPHEQEVDVVKTRYQSTTSLWIAARNEELKKIQEKLDVGVLGQQRKALVERLAVLKRTTEAGRQSDDEDKKAWVEKNYPGRKERAWEDKSLVDALIERKKQMRNIVLGRDTTTPLEEIDWDTSRFPQRRESEVDPGDAAMPSQEAKQDKKQRVGVLRTQPDVNAKLKPKGQDQDIGM